MYKGKLMSQQKIKLKKCAFGMSLGLTWAFGLILLVIVNAICPPWGNNIIKLLADVYIGYETSFLGAIYADFTVEIVDFAVEMLILQSKSSILQ